ncbi:pyridoxamine 5'-phosphate oxidase family protein [Marimonas arenosa]|uniref:Pyridoxamine 5'-phosphate oxidase family protein n=1 Tax=Marimonas arenosa TaxID=1795305 RepID=A0AAE3WDL9_9RHOB|nr:pyridoxamine 5'-phosphate oxidase family protein [Marimonas arenosa]MDQ2089800.1 pyridoxamine 5'-phosphate oxidase family protein [Marimonas arenosa]
MTAPTDRTRLRRAHERGAYDTASLHAVLDATCMCIVAYVIDGKPYATPTLHWREGDHVYWHGSSASRMLKQSAGQEVCLTVSILDGFVMARSGFHHSVNYRSAMLFGPAFKVPEDKKEARLSAFIDGLWPGRAAVLRPNNAQELKATTVLGMRIDEASAKVRDGAPVDDEEDYALPIWAGVIPVETRALEPVPDARNLPGVGMPEHIRGFEFPRK